MKQDVQVKFSEVAIGEKFGYRSDYLYKVNNTEGEYRGLNFPNVKIKPDELVWVEREVKSKD